MGRALSSRNSEPRIGNVIADTQRFTLASVLTPCDLCHFLQQRFVLVIVIEVIRVSSSPSQVAISAKQRDEQRIEISTSIHPMVTIDVAAGTDHTAATVTVMDVLSDSVPAFGLE